MSIGRKTDGPFLNRLSGEFCDLTDLISRCWFFNGAFTHDIESGGAMTDQTRNIDHGPRFCNGIEIAAVGFPVPGQTRENGLFGDVLNSLHHARQEFFIGWLTGREGYAAVAE